MDVCTHHSRRLHHTHSFLCIKSTLYLSNHFSLSWAGNFTPDGTVCYVMMLRWYMANRQARTSSLPEENRIRQYFPFAPVTLHNWRTYFRGGWWIFPAELTDTKRAECSQRALPGFTKNNSSSLRSSVQSVAWNKWRPRRRWGSCGENEAQVTGGWGEEEVGSDDKWGKVRSERVTMTTRCWRFVSRWSRRRGCLRHRLTGRRRRRPGWGCAVLSGWRRSCWPDPHAWSEQSDKTT